jgi:hypothetical protein
MSQMPPFGTFMKRPRMKRGGPVAPGELSDSTTQRSKDVAKFTEVQASRPMKPPHRRPR